MEYSISSNLLGGKTVHYLCDRCGTELESPLSNAGTPETCPACGEKFVCPGILEFEEDRKKAKEREAQEAREQFEADEEKRKKAEYKARIAAAEEQARLNRPPPPPPPPPELVWYGQMRCPSCGYGWQARRNTPPARCPNCGKRDVVAVRVQKMAPKASGCLTMIVLATGGGLGITIALLKTLQFLT